MPALRRFDHEAAYQCWAAIPKYRRTYVEVADAFGVSDVAVRKVALREKWHRRVRSKDVAFERKLTRRRLRRIILQVRQEYPSERSL